MMLLGLLCVIVLSTITTAATTTDLRLLPDQHLLFSFQRPSLFVRQAISTSRKNDRPPSPLKLQALQPLPQSRCSTKPTFGAGASASTAVCTFMTSNGNDDEEEEYDKYKYSNDNVGEPAEYEYFADMMKYNGPTLMKAIMEVNAERAAHRIAMLAKKYAMPVPVVAKVETENVPDTELFYVRSIENIKNAVICKLKEKQWKASILDDELNLNKSGRSQYQAQLRETIQRVRVNVIEPDIEASLVVLGILSRENLLLLGPPGMAMSALVRRLSKISGVVQLLTTSATADQSTSESERSKKDSGSTGGIVLINGLYHICEAVTQAADNVHFDECTSDLLQSLRKFLLEELNVDMSDHRLARAEHLLKISAASHGRTRVDPIDCLLLQHVAWNLPKQQEIIVEWLLKNITPGSMSGGGSKIVQYNILLNGLRKSAICVCRTFGDITGASNAGQSDVGAISSIRLEISQLVSLLQIESDALARHIELLRRSMMHLWLDPDQARTLQQHLIPIAERAWNAYFFTLCNAGALEILLTKDSETETVLSNDIDLSAIEQLWDDVDILNQIPVSFTEIELDISMKDAKAKYMYDDDTLKRWKKYKGQLKRKRKKAAVVQQK